jgi:hypothetical protein
MCHDAGLMAGSIHFHGRVRKQGNRPRACRLGAVGVGAEQKRRTEDAIRRGGPAGSYAGVPAVSQRHARVSSGGLVHEQENSGVRGEVGIANPSSSIILLHGPRHPATPFLLRSPSKTTTPRRNSWTLPSSLFGSLRQNIVAMAKLTIIAMNEEYLSGHSSPTAIPDKLLRHPRNLVTVEYFSSPILFSAEIHFPPILLYNQGYPKVCPDSLNLPNAGDSFAGISSLSSCSLFFPDQGLNCFDLGSSRVFSVKFPELSLF